jgi:YesN/AraC family two-component response regulator
LGCEWPIIIITGHGDIDACRKAFTHGGVDFLSKPIDEQDLIDAVQRASVLLEKVQAFGMPVLPCMKLWWGCVAAVGLLAHHTAAESLKYLG